MEKINILLTWMSYKQRTKIREANETLEGAPSRCPVPFEAAILYRGEDCLPALSKLARMRYAPGTSSGSCR
jgi:hypothetical protein